MKAEIPEIDPEIPSNAVSVYGADDAADDFPVLKAFQQYIDAEQAKARKRLMMLCTFFGVIMVVVIGFFMYVLHNADVAKETLSARNQALNDKLVDYAIKDRDRERDAPNQESAAIKALTAKLEEMQAQLSAAKDAKAKGPSLAEMEIEKLHAQLAIEKEKAAIEQAKLEAEREKQQRIAAEKERQRLIEEQEKARIAAEKEKQHQQELEEYRRKHYPELYAPSTSATAPAPAKNAQAVRPATVPSPSPAPSKQPAVEFSDADIDEILKNADLDDDEAVSYFDEEDDEDAETEVKRPTKKPKAKNNSPYVIPVDVEGTGSKWEIPE